MIIGIDGYAGAGKDTIADLFVSKGFTKVSFADELREQVSKATEVPVGLFLDRETKDADFKEPYILDTSTLTKFCVNLGKEPSSEMIDKFSGMTLISPRHMLQIMGTEIARDNIDNEVWIKRYKNRIKDLGKVVTPDARFDNERAFIKELRGQVMWVTRNNVEANGTHRSVNDKWPLEKYDVVIHNDESITRLHHEISLWWSLKRFR